MKRMCRAAIGLCVALALGSADGARAQQGSEAQAIADNFSSLSKLVSAGSYIAGLGFAVGSILQFKAQKDDPHQIPVGTPIALIFIGSYLIFHDTMSCPVFVADGTLLAEGTCAWTKATVDQQNANGDITNAVNGRVGGQLQVAPGWFVGGTLGVGGSWLQTGAGLFETGQNFDASVVVKRVDGPLFLAGALSVSTASTTYNLSGNSGVYIPGAPNTFTTSLRLRGAYEFPFEGWYLRPRTDVDIGYARTSGLQIVAPAATLTLDGTTKTTVMFTPALEIGARFDLGPAILRPYVVAGATILTDTSIPFSGNFNGFTFNGTSYTSPVIARLEAGLQFYQVKSWEMKLEYLLSAADSYLDQSLGLRVARHF